MHNLHPHPHPTPAPPILPRSCFLQSRPPCNIPHKYIQPLSIPGIYPSPVPKYNHLPALEPYNAHIPREGFFVGLVCYVSFRFIGGISIIIHHLSARIHSNLAAPDGKKQSSFDRSLGKFDISCLSSCDYNKPEQTSSCS